MQNELYGKPVLDMTLDGRFRTPVPPPGLSSGRTQGRPLMVRLMIGLAIGLALAGALSILAALALVMVICLPLLLLARMLGFTPTPRFGRFTVRR